MGAMTKRMISLPSEQSALIDELIASGRYGSASEVIRAGIHALSERDAAVDRWLRHEVVPIYDAMEAHPDRGIPAEKVFEDLRRHHAKRMRTAQRGT
jgi:antitoxin ParD1/3/4